MFGMKDKLGILEKKIKRLEWYCKTLDQQQDQIYKLFIEQQQDKKAILENVISELIKKQEERDKALAFFKEV